MTTTNFQLKRVATKTRDFSMAKDHTPPEAKSNQIKRQTQSKTPTPPEDKMSLDKPQGKHMPLKQQSKSKCI
jgi:hypothetical protein